MENRLMNVLNEMQYKGKCVKCGAEIKDKRRKWCNDCINKDFNQKLSVYWI